MAQYRKKPVVIEAWLARDLIRAFMESWSLPKPVADAYERGGWRIDHDHIAIPTLEGRMRAEFDDYVIMGVQGEFYPCKPDIFAETYEPVGG